MKKLLLSLALLTFLPVSCSPVFATVSSTTSKVIYTGDGSSSTFSFSYNIYKNSDLVVQKILISTGVVTTLVLNTDYTVALTHTAPTPGSITLVAGALASTYQLVILRTLPLTQAINITDPYYTTPAATWNEAHDRGVMLSQQLQEQLNRGLIGPATSSTQLTLPTGVAGLCLGWDGTGAALSNLTCSGGGGGGGSAFNPPIADSQLQAITTTNKVNGSAIYSLSSTPSGAGILPTANINVGTGASQVVQLTAASKYPAVDGSLITNLSGANFTNLASIPSGAGVIPAANLATSSHSFQAFTSNGNFTAPSGISIVYVTMCGGGGGGGKFASGTGGSGGGGGGAILLNYPYKVTAGNVYAVVVGAGGAKDATGVNGSPGVASTFDSVLNANGGSGGIAAAGTGSVGGAGGTANTNFAAHTTAAGFGIGNSIAGGAGGSSAASVSGGAGGGSLGSGAAVDADATANTCGGGGGGSNATNTPGNGGSGYVNVQY